MSENAQVGLLVVAVVLFLGVCIGWEWRRWYRSPARLHQLWVQSAEAEEMD